MSEAQDWFAQKHARTDIAHNPSYLVAHCGPVAMNPAVAAGGFSLLERAVFKSFMRIMQQVFAVRAEISALLMFVTAIPPDHDLNGLGLPPHSRVFPHSASSEWIGEYVHLYIMP